MAAQKKYKSTALIAKHFGFDVENKIGVSSEAVKLAKAAKKEPKYLDPNMPPIEEIIQLLLDYKAMEKEKGAVASFRYFDNPPTGTHDKLRKRNGEEQVSLHALGVEGDIAESMMIKSISMMLSENGYKKHTLHLNNVGGKECQTQFRREATAFFRKNISLLNADCRQYFKKDIHTLITVGGDQCKILKEHAPEPMDFIGEETREKFSNLLERMEALNIPYEINADVLGDLNYSSYTTFHFVDDTTGKIIAAGTRYNLLSKRIGIRKEISAISANVWVKSPKEVAKTSLDKISKSSLFLIQIGQEAKTASIQLLERLWKEKLHTKHVLSWDKIGPQIQLGKKLKSNFFMIIGHKEALDGSIMIRDHESKSQKILSPDELVKFLKKVK